MNLLANFRREPIRSQRLLDSARDQPCTMEVPRVCNRDPSTTVSAHIHDETFGFAIKADDCSSVHACAACHTWLDQGQYLGKMSIEQVLRIVIRALQRTLRNRIERGFIVITGYRDPKPKSRKPTSARKSKDQRANVPAGRKLQGGAKLPRGRKLQTANNLRRS